jgi:hypothetical protein
MHGHAARRVTMPGGMRTADMGHRLALHMPGMMPLMSSPRMVAVRP